MKKTAEEKAKERQSVKEQKEEGCSMCSLKKEEFYRCVFFDCPHSEESGEVKKDTNTNP